MNTDPIQERPNQPIVPACNATATITVTDMQCSGCESIIETALNSLPSVYGVKANYSSGQVVVNFNASMINLKELIREIAVQVSIRSAIASYTLDKHYYSSASTFTTIRGADVYGVDFSVAANVSRNQRSSSVFS
jgi:copper chaperone CopZ